METSKPQHGIGDELVTQLKALQIVFIGRYVVFAEYAELVLGQTEDHIGIEPGIFVVAPRRTGSSQRLGCHKDFKFLRRVFMVGERGAAREQGRQGEQTGYTPGSRHSEGSDSARGSHGAIFVTR